MKRTEVLLFTIGVLLVTAHRLPAPIQEIQETPTPAVTPAAEQKPPPPPKPEAPKAAPVQKEKAPTTEEEPASVSPHHDAVHTEKKEAQSADGTIIPKGAVHLVIHSESDARKIFTYFRFPQSVAKPGTTGLYRIEVNPDGTVAAVTILKSMGGDQDLLFMQAFVRWRANPGPLRIVDVPRQIFQYFHVRGH